MGEALFGREDLHADTLLHRFRRRPRTHAWAKPCLAGRPTALVRTLPPETHTSRGRPAGMELPDYPVVATLPTPWDQDGPAPPLPTGSFPRFVPRHASHRVFSPIRTSSRFPPGLFPDSYLVTLPAGLLFPDSYLVLLLALFLIYLAAIASIYSFRTWSPAADCQSLVSWSYWVIGVRPRMISRTPSCQAMSAMAPLA
jgi:hypothetical protein